MMEVEIQYQLLQPWSTFVMKTKLPPSILEKMIKITDEILKNKEPKERAGKTLAGQIEDEFWIAPNILEREDLMEFFLDVCRNYVIQAFCQSAPFDKENILKEEFMTQMTRIWINSQKDNEYFTLHNHNNCALSSVMYLKIPEYLPSRRTYWKDPNYNDDGAIVFSSNSSDTKWSKPYLQIQPQLGDFLLFPAEQLHQVYPFRTPDGKGEIRSVSFNALFSSKSEQDILKKH